MARQITTTVTRELEYDTDGRVVKETTTTVSTEE